MVKNLVKQKTLRVLGIAWLLSTLIFFPLNPITEEALAQNSSIFQVLSNSAKARYGAGLYFSLKIQSHKGEIKQAELRVTAGRNGPKELKIEGQVTPGNPAEVTAALLTETPFLTAGMPVNYSWIISNSEGDKFQTENKVITYEDTRFNWRQRSGPQVTVRWYSGSEDYGNLMFTLASDALATYNRRFSISPYEPIYISIYGSNQEYFDASPNVPYWSGGYTLVERNEILAVAPQNRVSSILIGEGIPHELSHAALFQHLGHRHAPTWLDEGLAVYNQNVVAPEYDAILQKAFGQETLAPLANFNQSFPREVNAAKLAYAEGRGMVTFLINNYGDKVWANLLDQLRYGDIDQATDRVFGVKLKVLEEQWHNSLGGKKLALPPALLKGPVSPIPPVPTLESSLGRLFGPYQPFLLAGLALGFCLVSGLVVFLSLRKRNENPRTSPNPAGRGYERTEIITADSVAARFLQEARDDSYDTLKK